MTVRARTFAAVGAGVHVAAYLTGWALGYGLHTVNQLLHRPRSHSLLGG